MLEKEKLAPENREYKRAVGVFKKREDLEDTLRALKNENFDMERVSLLARDVEGVEGGREVTEKQGNEAKEGAGIGASTGTVLGGIGGFLTGVGLLAVPGVGPILAAGAEISAVASTLAGAGIGAAAGGIVGALVGLGIPEEKAKVYSDRIKAGDYLLIVSGNEDEVNRAGAIMRDRHIEEFEIFEAPDRTEAERAPRGKRVEVREEVQPVSDRAEMREEEAIETRDLTGDGNPEVIIVDKTKHREVR